jgi:hypothetical protein
MPAIRMLPLAFALAVLAACSSPPPPQSTASPAAKAAEPAREFKPGSHAATMFSRLQHLRVAHPDRFKRLLEAYAASHGDVNHPRLAVLRNDVMQWLAMSKADYAQLPVYLKTFSGSGPYRRLITRPGYSYVGGSVYLPCKAAHLRPSFETAFAYVGGWGVGAEGTAVDAGFQRSNAFDDYAAFIRAQGFPQISKEPRFVCGHTVDFAFSAVSDTDLRLWTKGYTENRKVEVVVADLQHPASYGWPANGGGSTDGIVLKRMTTIGQSDPETALPAGTAWDADGSYFGRVNGDKRPKLRWSNLEVGQVDAHGKPVSVAPWGIAQTDESVNAGTRNYPDSPTAILFTCTGCPDESDAIDLAK